MENTAVLEKILNVKENEKKDAQIEKTKAVDHFEQVATALYDELKRKETAEETMGKVMEKQATITTIIEQSQYINLMKTKINTLQSSVQEARTEMEEKQALLTEAHVEVKKIERLIELRQEEAANNEQKEEMKLMDEISARQYLQYTQNR